MPEKVVDLLNAITALKGEEFAEGLVAGVNLVSQENKAMQEPVGTASASQPA